MKFFASGLLAIALAAGQLLIGGTRLLYSIPVMTLLAVAALLAGWPSWRTSACARAGCLVTTALFFAYLLARNRFSPVDYVARPDFFILIGACIVYLLVSLFLTRSRLRVLIASGMLLLGLAHTLVGAIQFKRGDDFMLLPWFQRTASEWRASGFYISPNHYAGVLEVMALVGISITFWGALKLGYRMLIGYVAVCCMLGLALSGSRGGYLSLGAGIIVFVILSLVTVRKVSPARFWPTLFVAAAALMLFATMGTVLVSQSSELRKRISQIDDPKNPRWLLWDAAIQQFRLSPITGTGSGTYLYYGRTFRNPIIQDDPIFVHNDYLHLLAEYGVVGAIFFVVFFGWHLGAGMHNIGLLVKGQAPHRNHLALQLGALSAIAAYAVHSMVDFNLHIPANAFLIALIFGVIANPGLPARGETPCQMLTRRLGRISLVAMGVVVLSYGLPQLPGEWYAEKARVALRKYQLAEARDFAKSALRSEQRNPDIYYYAGEAAREMSLQKMGPAQELSDEAVKMFKEGLAQSPQDVRLVYKLAQAYDERGDYLLAERQLERASELDPHASLLQAYYGMHYQKQGLLEQAEERYDAAFMLDPRNLIARAGLESVRKALAPLRNVVLPGAQILGPSEVVDEPDLGTSWPMSDAAETNELEMDALEPEEKP